MRYHIAKNGLPAECTAKTHCPLGGEHYEDKVEALQGAIHLALKPQLPPSTDLFDRISEATRAKDTEEINRLRKDKDARVREAVARNLNCNWVTISNMVAAESDEKVLLALAEHHQLTNPDAGKLAGHKTPEIRAAIASRADLSMVNMIGAFRDEDPSVRAAYARNRNAQWQHLLVLAHDESKKVRLAVARNSSTPVGVLEGLMSPDEEDDDVRLKARVNFHQLTKNQRK